MILLERPFLLQAVSSWLRNPSAGPLDITGSSGVGKTWLLSQLASSVPDCTWLFLPPHIADGPPPLAGIAEGLALACAREQGHAAMEACLPLDARQFLLSMEGGHSRLLPLRAGVEHALARLFGAALDLLGHGVVVVVDELGSADDFSLEILADLSGVDSPLQGRLRMVTACVDHEQLPNGPLWERKHHPARPRHVLALPSWRLGEVRAWLEAHFGTSFVQQESALVKKLHRASMGLPHQLVLLLEDLRQRGVVHYTAQGWTCSRRRIGLGDAAPTLRLRLMRQRVEDLQSKDPRALGLFALLRCARRLNLPVLEEVLTSGFPLEDARRHPAVAALCDAGVARLESQSQAFHLCLSHDSWRNPGVLPLEAEEELSLCRDLRRTLATILPDHPFLQLHLLLWEASLAGNHRRLLFQEADALVESHADGLLVVRPSALGANPEMVPLWEALLHMEPPAPLAAKLRLILVLHYRRQGRDALMEALFQELDPALLNTRDRQLYLYLGMEHRPTRHLASQRFADTVQNDDEVQNLRFNRFFDLVCDLNFDAAAPLARELLDQPLSDELMFRTEFLAMVCSQSHTPISKECLQLWQERYQERRGQLSLQSRHDMLDWMGSISLNFRHDLHLPFKDEHLDVVRHLGWSESASRIALREANLCLLYDDDARSLALYNEQAKALLHNSTRPLATWSLNHIQALLNCGRADLAYSIYCCSLGGRTMDREELEAGLVVERALLHLLAGHGAKAHRMLEDLPLESLAASPHFGPHVAHMVLATCSWMKQSALIQRIEAVRNHPAMGPWDHLLWHWCASDFSAESVPDFNVEGCRLIPWFYALPVCEIALAGNRPALAEEAAQSLAPGLRQCEHHLAMATAAALAGDQNGRDQHVLQSLSHNMQDGLPRRQAWVTRLFPDFHLRKALAGMEEHTRQMWMESLLPEHWRSWPPEALNAIGQWELGLDAQLPGALSHREFLGKEAEEGQFKGGKTPSNGTGLRIRLLGHPCLILPGGVLLKIPKASWRLLGYLLCKSDGQSEHSNRPRLLREVCGIGEDPKALQLAFSQLLQRLKNCLGTHDVTRDWLEVDRLVVKLGGHAEVEVDWKAFGEAILHARALRRSRDVEGMMTQAERAMSLYGGPFMDGVEAPWISAVRAASERDFEWLSALLLSHYQEHAPSQAESLRQRILSRAPYLAQVPQAKWGA